MDFTTAPAPQLIMSVKPTKSNGLMFLQCLWGAVWSFAVFLFFGGAILIGVVAAFMGSDDLPFGMMALVGIVFFAIFVVISFLFQRAQLNAIEYRFFDSKIESVDGFLVKSKKNIPYTKITNTEQGQSITERIFNLQHINIDTAGGSGHELVMRYVDNSEELFNTINAIIHNGSKA